MRTPSYVLALPLVSIAMTAFVPLAVAEVTTGTIERFHPATNSFDLTSGRTFMLPATPSGLHGLSSGDHVTITWSMVGQDAVASRIVVDVDESEDDE